MAHNVLELVRIKQSDLLLQDHMRSHYSQPKGFVGRNICYAVIFDGVRYGSIVGGSATLHLAGRDEAFGIDASDKRLQLRRIINNIFFHIYKVDAMYPRRNFAPYILSAWRDVVLDDWTDKYGDVVLGYETLVELPRSGECYRRDGWQEVGLTKGYTCKRVAGTGTDSWSGRRVWDLQTLRPKRVFVYPLPNERLLAA